MVKIAVIVPAYHPTEDMLPMLKRLLTDERFVPVVVNDGSGPEYDRVFRQLPEGCLLLTHEVNRGKGAAMKTAMHYILEKLPECELAVTADADGQHRYEDILKVVEIAGRHAEALVLGSRRFTGDVPLRSRFGNGITRQVFAVASGVKVYDTQTGLRAFGRDSMRRFAEIAGERYEYEINMLLFAARNNITILEETIETVYLNDNSASSFHPFRDSMKIYLCILKFALSSFASYLIDFGLVMLLNALIGDINQDLKLLICVVCARLVSASFNFVVNKVLVFNSKNSWKSEFLRYAALCGAVLAANYLMIDLLNARLGWSLFWSKALVEVILFVMNFFVQGKLVYKRGSAKNG